MFFSFLLLLNLLLFIDGNQYESDPVANPTSMVFVGDCIRVTVLTARVVRIERAKLPHTFEDRESFAIVNRRLPSIPYTVKTTGESTVIMTGELQIHVNSTNSNRCDRRFASGEVQVKLLQQPYTVWTTTGKLHSEWKSSVAHIVPDPLNLNGTMNYGPAFAGGLDCYSNPPTCEEGYKEKIGQGLLSKSGISIVDDTNGTRIMTGNDTSWPPRWFDPNSTRPKNHVVSQDLYIVTSPDLNYTATLFDFAKLSGPPALPPLAALGVWYSRYFPYGEESWFNEIYDNYEKYGLPLNVAVFDVPWHTIDFPPEDLPIGKNATYPYHGEGTAEPDAACNGWDGFTFNSTLFPNPKRFFDRVHAKGVKTILSVHIQNGVDHCQSRYEATAKAFGFSDEQIKENKTVPCETDNPKFIESLFGQIIDQDPVNLTDYFWLDYPGGASQISGWNSQEPASLYWSNRMFAEYARLKQHRRPVILARYGGLGQQRDGLGFSGDTFQSFKTLEFEVEMTSKASNVLFGWWSHDIGGNHNSGYSGYQPDPSKPTNIPFPGDENPMNRTGSEMLLRWIQFGALSPILRTHCEPSCDRYLWHYQLHFNEMRAALRLRNSLVPYIYTMARSALDSGISLIRPMYYSFPREDAAYDSTYAGQYMFGSSILAAPVTSPTSNVTGKAEKSVWLPSGYDWIDFKGKNLYSSDQKVGTQWSTNEIPLFVKDGTILPLRTEQSTHSSFVDPLHWVAWTTAGGRTVNEFELFEDQGDGLDRKDEMRTQAVFTATPDFATFTIHPSEGSFIGSKKNRTMIFQLRYCPESRVESVIVDGKAIPHIEEGGSNNSIGYYFSQESPDRRDEFLYPENTLIITAGRKNVDEIRKVIVKLRDVKEEITAL
eukprot:g5812.t1